MRPSSDDSVVLISQTAPRCTDQAGRPVRFLYVRRATLNKVGHVLGVAAEDRHNGNPIALIDIETLTSMPVEFRNQVILHECAHHENGDVAAFSSFAASGQWSVMQESQTREDAADCRSVRRLRDEFSYGAREFDRVFSSIELVGHRLNVPPGIAKYRTDKLRKCLMNA